MVTNGPLDAIILRGDWRRRIVRENEALARRLQAAYERTLPRLRAEIDGLNQRMAELYEINGGLNAQEVRGLRQWNSLMAAIETENRDFAAIARNEAAQGQRDAIRAGASAAQEMAQSTSGRLGPAVAANWNRPDAAALEQLINYVDGPALRAEFTQFGTRAAKQFADVVLAAVAQGKNPLALARIMELWLSVPYAQAENIARTTQLWSYRSATHAAYRVNSEVVTGWLWYSAADDRSCISCWSQHGSVHPVNEMLADHHRGRCLVPGQSVTTLRGDVAIENVQVGDYVLTHAGNWERVLTLFQRNYTGEVITIESGGYRVTVTPEHPVWTQRGWVEARHLNASDTFRTLCSSEARVSSNKTSHPRCINRLVRLWSMGRFFLVLCQRACHSTANFISGKAKSMLYVSTAICGTGDNPCARNTSRKRYSLSDIWLRVFCLMIAVFSLVSSLCPARIKGVRKSGSFCNWSERDCAGVLGSMPESLMSFIRDRVLMPISLTSCRYDACSSTYRRERYKATGSPILDSSSLSQTLVFRAPINSGDNAGSLKEERLWSTACFALPNAFAMSIADIVSWFSRRNLSSSSDHFLPAMLNSCSTGNSIHHSLYFGKVYDIEVDKDHSFIAGGVAVHNCVPVPVVRGTRWAEDFEPGPVRFAGLDAERQRAIMGPALYAAWRAGDVRWGDFSRPYQDNVFGEMLRAASLRELLGDEARRYYSYGR